MVYKISFVVFVALVFCYVSASKDSVDIVRRSYLREALPYYRLYERIDQRQPQRVLLMGGLADTYHLNVPAKQTDPVWTCWVPYDKLKNCCEMAAFFENQGYSFAVMAPGQLVGNPEDLKRVPPWYNDAIKMRAEMLENHGLLIDGQGNFQFYYLTSVHLPRGHNGKKNTLRR